MSLDRKVGEARPGRDQPHCGKLLLRMQGRQLSSLAQVGQNSGPQGCEGTPWEVRRGNWGRSPLPAVCKHLLWLQLRTWTAGLPWKRAQLAIGCLWNGANHNWNFPPTQQSNSSCFGFFPLPSLKFPSWFFSWGVWSPQQNVLFCSLKFVPVFSVTSTLCLWERIRPLKPVLIPH